MKKYLLLFLLLSVFTNLAIAQKKTAKKSIPSKVQPPKIKRFTPPKIVRPEPEPQSEPLISEEMGNNAVPTVMESSEATKFRKERICTTCDTLKLESNKAHIIIYDVKWMADTESRIYRKQPTKNDLNNSYYALSGQNKREWDELQRNFPEDKFTYHHVFRNTYIEIPNKKHQILNLLDRQERHEGFVYWSGKENDSTVNRKKMVLLTEAVAKETAENKTSAYYKDFLRDSLAIANFQKTTHPASQLMANMNVLLQNEIFGETVIPFQFLDVNKLSRITVQSEADQEKQIILKLNNKGQLTQTIEGKRDSTSITYQNNLPLVVKKRDQVINFYYHGDTVIIKDRNYLKVNKLVGKIFFEVQKYRIEKDNYADMTLDKGYETKLINNNTNTCIKEVAKDGHSSQVCYSNTNWELPLTVETNSNDRIETKTYIKNAENSLVIENLNGYKSTRYDYVLSEGKMTTLKSSFKRNEGPYSDPYLLSISYEYFK